MKTQLPGIDAAQAAQQTERVIASRVFAKAARSQRLLRYLVSAAFADPPRTIKEYTLATEVFDRSAGYDPAIDATVRVEAGRLRTRLREYYAEEGRHDILLIEVPKGAYRVVLTLRGEPEERSVQPEVAANGLRALPVEAAQPWPASAPDETSMRAGPHTAPAGHSASGTPPDRVEPLRGNREGRWSSEHLPKRYAFPLLCLIGILGLAAWRIVQPRRTQAKIRSMAVLPLKNVSGDPGQEFFSDGATDELITELARVPELRVVSWNSVLQEKDTKKPLKAIAEELHADVLVEGSVARSGENVRINAQLIDTRTDSHLWAGSFEGRASEMMALETKAAQEIVAHTRVAVLPASASPIQATDEVPPAAHDAYLRGKNYFDKRRARASAEQFQLAIDLDPNYSAAYAGLASALESEALLGEGSPQQVIPRGMAAAQRSLELDPQNGDALIAQGSIEMNFLWEWEAAERDLRRGLALSPNNSFGHMMLSVYLDALGKPADAVQQMQQAVEIDPLSFFMARHYGSALFFARRYDEALRQLEYAREMQPESAVVVDSWLSAVYEKQGRYGEAVRYDLSELGKLDPKANLSGLLATYSSKGWRAYWAVRLNAGLNEKSQDACTGYFSGLAAIQADRPDDAIAGLRSAVEKHCYWTIVARSDPRLDALRGDARFHQIVASLHLPQD